ncbi:MAG: FliH/SctL family protein [Bordetella sp.]|nr:FliH/SctL family protein [Bordetella sp.]
MSAGPIDLTDLRPSAAGHPRRAGGQVLRAPDLSLPVLHLGRAGGGTERPGGGDTAIPPGESPRLTLHEEPPSRSTAEGETAFASGGELGYEEGLRQGLADGRAQAERELQQAGVALQQAMNERVQQAMQEGERLVERRVQTLESEAQAAVESRLRQLDGVIGALHAEALRLRAQVEDDVLAICHAAVCRILGERALQPEVLATHLSDIVRNVPGEGLPTVHVHPDDLAVMTAVAGRPDGQATAFENLAQVRWRASADVELGGCIVQGDKGGLDARWETQLAELRAVLQRERRARAQSSLTGS